MSDADAIDTKRIVGVGVGGVVAIAVGYVLVALLFGARPFVDPPATRAGPTHILARPLGVTR
jgi:hypothetical protein